LSPQAHACGLDESGTIRMMSVETATITLR
jgi:hypothetical protein